VVHGLLQIVLETNINSYIFNNFISLLTSFAIFSFYLLVNAWEFYVFVRFTVFCLCLLVHVLHLT
jgi:hypothetical protein